jgi:inosine/xanthosine triphosphate pyrophosphatase family protein
MAELSAERKNAISHRGRAAAAMRPRLAVVLARRA